MTKLEQCIRLTMALDEGGKVEIYIEENAFHLKSMGTSEDEEMAYGTSVTFEGAVDALHSALQERVKSLRAALNAFEST